MRIKPDIVHYNLSLSVFGRSRIANFIGLTLPFITRLLGYKTITTMHNFPETINPETAGLKRNIINITGLFLATKLACSSHIVVVLVRSYINIVRRRYNKNTVLIPHGAWFTEVKPNYNIAPTILFLGHIGPNKDLQLLIDSYRKLKQQPKLRKIRLFIVGAPHPIFPEYIKMLKRVDGTEDIAYMGYIDNKEIPKLMEKVGVIVLPYKACTGTSGVVHLLAAFGKPIVASDHLEFRELKKEGAGIVIVKHKVEHYTKTLKKILLSNNMAKQIGKANRKFAEKRKWSIIARKYLKLYQSLIK